MWLPKIRFRWVFEKPREPTAGAVLLPGTGSVELFGPKTFSCGAGHPSLSFARPHCRRFDRWTKDGAISRCFGDRPGVLGLNSPADSSAQMNRAILILSFTRRRRFPGSE